MSLARLIDWFINTRPFKRNTQTEMNSEWVYCYIYSLDVYERHILILIFRKVQIR